MSEDGQLGLFTARDTWEMCLKRVRQTVLFPQKFHTQHTMDSQGVSELLLAVEGGKDPSPLLPTLDRIQILRTHPKWLKGPNWTPESEFSTSSSNDSEAGGPCTTYEKQCLWIGCATNHTQIRERKVLMSSMLKVRWWSRQTFQLHPERTLCLMILHRSRETCAGCPQDMITDPVNSDWREKWICRSVTLAEREGLWNRCTWKIKWYKMYASYPVPGGLFIFTFF